jgi:transposase
LRTEIASAWQPRAQRRLKQVPLVMRAFGLDVQGDFCEVAVAEHGEVRSVGRIATRVDSLQLFAQSLVTSDVVALEATTRADRIVSLLQTHGIRVVVANTRKLRSITEAKAKTDRLDARTLARLLASGLLDEIWTPDERTRALRQLTNRRERLVRARTRVKNEAHGVLVRNLCERAPVTDTFGKAGRRWLAGLELPLDEQLTLEGCLRQVDFLDAEIAALDAEIAKQALDWSEVLWLMSVPGANVQTAASFMATIGDIGRCSSPRKLVSYPASTRASASPAIASPATAASRKLVPRSRGTARRGRLEGDADAGSTARLLRARPRTPRPAVWAAATARKLAVLFRHLLTRDEDYAFARPAMTRNKIRRLELLAGAPPQTGRHGIAGGKSKTVFDAERELSRQAEAAYRRLVSDWRSTGPAKAGAGVTSGRASRRPSKGTAARQTP